MQNPLRPRLLISTTTSASNQPRMSTPLIPNPPRTELLSSHAAMLSTSHKSHAPASNTPRTDPLTPSKRLLLKT